MERGTRRGAFSGVRRGVASADRWKIFCARGGSSFSTARFRGGGTVRWLATCHAWCTPSSFARKGFSNANDRSRASLLSRACHVQQAINYTPHCSSSGEQRRSVGDERVRPILTRRREGGLPRRPIRLSRNSL